MKKLLVTFLLSIGLSGITLNASAQTPKPGAPVSGSIGATTFTVDATGYNQPIQILQLLIEGSIVAEKNCTSNSSCSFKVWSTDFPNGGSFSVNIGTVDGVNHCIYQISWNPILPNKLDGLTCGGNITAVNGISDNKLTLKNK